MPRQAECIRLLADVLEDRVLLSAAALSVPGVATPMYINNGAVSINAGHINPPNGIHPSGSPSYASVPYTPAEVETAYGDNNISFGSTSGTGAGETVAIVDAYNDPNIIGDTQTFDTQFGLPQFNTGGPTLTVLNQTGGSSLTGIPTGQGWDIEESLDVQWVHSMAPEANIILFVANTNNNSDMYQAVATAADYPGVSVISMSWSTGEYSTETSDDPTFATPSGHQGVTFLAATGDTGTPAGYPAFSPNVVAVGGTSLTIQTTGAYVSETPWDDSSGADGGGISLYESLPSYQDDINGANGASTTFRNVPDVSMDADPATGVYVRDTLTGGTWWQVGGTSLATPLTAGLIAVANQGRALNGLPTLNGATQTLPTLYSLYGNSSTYAADFHDVTSGTNGTYSAGTGYDLATGIGTPIANNLVPALADTTANTPPSISAPSSVSVSQDSGFMFIGANAITVSDAQTGSTPDSLSLSVSHGTITLEYTGSLTFTSGVNGSSSMTVTGPLNDLQVAVIGPIYTPTPTYSGSDTLHLSMTNPNDGLSYSPTVSITVNAVSAPTITAPASVSVNENSSFTFSSPNTISVADSAAGGGNSDSLSLSVSHGTLTLASTTGLTFTSGSNGASSMTVTGTVSNFDADLGSPSPPPAIVYSDLGPGETYDAETADVAEGLNNIYFPGTQSAIAMRFTPAATVNFDAVLLPLAYQSGTNSVTVDLFASSGGEPASTPLESFTATGMPSFQSGGTIYQLNSVATPVLTAGQTYWIALLPGGANTAADWYQTPTSALGGAYSTNAGSTWSYNPYNPSMAFEVLGTLSPFAGLTYTPTPAYSGSDSLVISLSDPTDGLSHSTTVPINASALPAPSITAPSSASTYDDGALVFSGSTAISFADSAAGSNSDTLTLTVSQGTLTLGSTTGLSFTSGSNGSASITVTGTVSNLDAALSGAIYTPTVGFPFGYTGSDSLVISVSDPSDGQNASKTVGLTVNAFPSPTVTAPTSVSVNENSSLTFSGADAVLVGDSNTTLGALDVAEFSYGYAESTTGNGTFNTLNTTSNNLVIRQFPGTVQDVALANYALGGVIPSGATITSASLHFDTTVITSNPGQEVDVDAFDALGNVSLSEATASGTQVATYNSDTLGLGEQTMGIPASALPPLLAGSSQIGLRLQGDATGANTAIDSGVPNSDNAPMLLVNYTAPITDNLSLSVSDGTLTLGSTTGLSFVAGSNSSSSMTVNGAISALENALIGLTYTPTSGYVGSDTLVISLVNLGDAQHTEEGYQTVPITVKVPAPTVTAPSSASVNENSSLTFPGNISVADANAGSGSDSLTLSVSHGTLTLSSTAGLSFTSGSNGASAMTVTGMVSNLSSDLDNLTYAPTPLYTGSDSLHISVTDPGDSLSGSATVSLTVNALPAPTITAPSSASLNENSSFTFSGGNAISVADSAAGSGSDSLALSVSHGTLTLSLTTGLTFTSGSNGAAAMTVTGMVSNLSTDLANLLYTPTALYAGSDSLAISITDPADGQNASKSVAITVNALPAPTITAPSSASLNENSSFTFSGGNAISVADSAAGSGSDSLALSVSHGTLTLSLTSGLTFTSGSNGAAAMTVTGMVSNISTDLANLLYTPTVLYTGSDSLAISITDPADAQNASKTVALTVNALAAPTITAPSSASLNENSSLTFSGANGISVADSAAGSGSDSLALSVSHGKLTLSSTSGLSFTAGTNGTSSMTVTGAVSNLSADLANLLYTPTPLYYGSDSLQISITDPGDGENASKSVSLTVNALPAPTISAPSSEIVGENTPFVFSGTNAISVADSAAGSNSDSLTISVSHGTLTLSSTTGLTFTSGANGAASMTVTGAISSLSADLANLEYTPSSNYTGSDSLQISITDPADGRNASTAVSLSVSTASGPTVTYPTGLIRALINAPVYFNGTISVTDPSAGTNVEQLTLSATHGTLTLGGTTGITFVSGGNSSAAMTITGTLAHLNAALNGMAFVPTPNYSGVADVSISYKDLGDGLTSSGVVAIYYSRILSDFSGSPAGIGAPTTVAPTNVAPTSSTASPSVAATTVSSEPTSTAPPQTNDASADFESDAIQWSGLSAALEVLAG